MASEMPDGWDARPLEECVSAIIDYRGKSPRKTTSGVPLITAKIVKRGRIETPTEFIAAADYDSWMRRGLPEPGDVLITTEAPLGEVAQLDDATVALAQRVILLRGDSAALDNQYLKYALQSDGVQSQLKARSTGTTVFGIRQSELRRVVLPLPPLREQRRIAKTLGAIDDKIELNRRMNSTLESIARALFQSWFVDFDPVRKKMEGGEARLPAHLAALFPSSISASAIGPIPTGWCVSTLGEVASELEAGSRPIGGVGEIDSGVPSIGAESIVGLGRFDFGKTKHVGEEFWANMRRGHVKNRDILVYKDGGRPGMFEPHVTMVGDGFPFEVCCINEHVYRLRMSDLLSPAYMYFWLTSELAMGEMRERGTGVAIPSLNSTAFRAVPVLVPDAAAVHRFTHDVEAVVAAILRNAKESQTLASVGDALLPKLMSGELAPANTIDIREVAS